MHDKSITSSDMRILEVNAEYFGVPRTLLMENAGSKIAEEIASRFTPIKPVAVFCGLGGNGGDGFVAARHLSSMGYAVTIVLAGRPKEISDKAALKNWRALQFLKETIPIHEVYDSTLIPDINAEIVIDALLGIGAKGELRPPILQLVNKINAMNTFRVSVDVPTGVDADTGEVSNTAVKADLTITFHKRKVGLENAAQYVGDLVVKSIGLPLEIEHYSGPGDVLAVTTPRPSASHKGDHGRLLVIGGSETFSGAPTLVAQAALRTGVDLTYVAAPEQTALTISSLSADLITIKLAGNHLKPKNVTTLEDYIKSCDSIVLGPGLGLHPKTRETVEALIEIIERVGKPLLLDADGLKAFAEFKKKLDVPFVLTPHAKEYALLTGKNPPTALSEKVLDVQRTAADLNAVVLLKGPADIISDGRQTKVNFTGNPGMTVGGTGDVLSGIVGALLAKHVDPFHAAVVGAFVNGAAGDFVFEEKGPHMVSTDLINWIPHVFNDPMSHARMHKADAKKG